MERIQKVRTFISRCRGVVMILILVCLLCLTPKAGQISYVVKATGYCPCEICCGKWADGETAMGDKADRGSIAIDPKANFDMGDIVYVEGYGFGIFNDVGSAIRGKNRVDLCFRTHQEALDWGVRYVVLWIVKKKS